MSNKQRVLGTLAYGLTFVVSAPAGTGKTTLVDMLREEFDCVKESISSTTRPARAQEVNGVHYHFLSEDEFNKQVAEGKFLEHVTLFGFQYGTSFASLETIKSQGKHAVLVIDTQGALELKNRIEATFIFIQPPSLQELKKRLVGRGTEKDAVITERLQVAEKELALSHLYDYIIINDDLSVAYQVLRSILIAEEHRVKK
ncbi:MAG: gmk [Chlamydiia bacterium]|nr:gmk [Chlamydiia bacterium]